MQQVHALREYQQTIARVVLGSVLRGLGEIFTVEIAHHGGARELSAQAEFLHGLLTLMLPVSAKSLHAYQSRLSTPNSVTVLASA